uniref:Ommochrome-binding protein-like n=2 Tax=Meloidogyne hapla TaxID=6305 RepID=A0A1I8BA19_MELHA
MDFSDFLFVLLYFITIFNNTSAKFKEIAKRTVLLEQSAGNFKKGNQYLAERVLFTLSAFFPMNRFLILISNDGRDMLRRPDHSDAFVYADKHVFIYIVLIGDGYLGSLDCYGNVEDEFESCHPQTDKLLRRIGDICGEDGGYNSESVGIRAVVKDIDFGVASSLPSYALKDEKFRCSNSSDRYRNGLFVTSKNSSTLYASEQQFDEIWEEFLVQINIEDGTISFKSRVNQKYVSVDLKNGGILILGSDTVKNKQKFIFEKKENEEEYTLKSKINEKYVSVKQEKNGILMADMENVTGPNEIFEFNTFISEKERNELLSFPNIIDEDKGVYISPFIGILAFFGTCVGFAAMSLMFVVIN